MKYTHNSTDNSFRLRSRCLKNGTEQHLPSATPLFLFKFPERHKKMYIIIAQIDIFPHITTANTQKSFRCGFCLWYVVIWNILRILLKKEIDEFFAFFSRSVAHCCNFADFAYSIIILIENFSSNTPMLFN